MGKSLSGKELGRGISQREDGSYQARFTNSFGKMQYVYAKTITEVRNKLDEAKFNDKIASGTKVDKITLNQWFDIWMNTYNLSIRDTTRMQYNKMYDKIRDNIGRIRIKNITSTTIQQTLNSLSSDPYRKRVRSLLHAMFERAMDDGYITKNPVKRSEWKVSGIPQKERVPLNLEQESIFIDYIYKPRCKQSKLEHVEMFEFILNTGLRLGEVTGLKWEDIDFDNKVINVNRSLSSTPTIDRNGIKCGRHPRFNEPKSEAGKRKIPLDNKALEILNYERKRDNEINSIYEPPEGFENLIFVSWLNTPIYDDTIRRTMRKITLELQAKYSDFPNVSPHVLRHTFATRCVEKGMNIKTLQTIMGHSNQSITMNVYTHTTSDGYTEALNILNS